MKSELLTELFERASSLELGLVISTNNPDHLMKELHAHRKLVGRWTDLMIATPSQPNLLFLVHKSVELDP